MTDLQRSVATATSRRDLVLFFATVRLPCHWRRCIIQSCGNMVVTVYPSIHSKALQHVSLQRGGKATWTASSIIFLQDVLCQFPTPACGQFLVKANFERLQNCLQTKGSKQQKRSSTACGWDGPWEETNLWTPKAEGSWIYLTTCWLRRMPQFLAWG